MKKELIYSCAWQKDKINSWSGTHMAIRSRLDKFYNIKDFDWGEKTLENKIQRICSKFLKEYVDMNCFYTKKFTKRFGNNNIIFCYDNTPLNYSKSNIYFVYQDFTWHFFNHIYDTRKDLWNINFHDNFQKKRMDKLINKQNEFYFQSNVHCLTMSKWLYNYYIENMNIPANRVHYVGGGINIDITKIDTSKKSGNKFLFVGKDFERKNGPLVIEAFKKIHKNNPKYEIYIAGPSNLKVNYDGIYNLGLLKFEELIKYFNLCDVFVMPSLFEGFGLVFCEALAYGLPCIGNNCFEMPYFIKDGENGYILKNQDSNELANLMIQAIENLEMRKFVMNNSQEYIKEYSWDSVIDRIVNVIEDNT